MGLGRAEKGPKAFGAFFGLSRPFVVLSRPNKDREGSEGFPKGSRRVPEGFPKGSRRVPEGFPQGWEGIPAGVEGI